MLIELAQREPATTHPPITVVGNHLAEELGTDPLPVRWVGGAAGVAFCASHPQVVAAITVVVKRYQLPPLTPIYLPWHRGVDGVVGDGNVGVFWSDSVPLRYR